MLAAKISRSVELLGTTASPRTFCRNSGLVPAHAQTWLNGSAGSRTVCTSRKNCWNDAPLSGKLALEGFLAKALSTPARMVEPNVCESRTSLLMTPPGTLAVTVLMFGLNLA